MFRTLFITLLMFLLLILQVTVLPYFLRETFVPNLLLLLVVYLGVKEEIGLIGTLLAFCQGLLHDTFSGIYLGLSGFSFLVIYLVLRLLRDQLYTDSSTLMVVVAFLATLAHGVLCLLLLLLFSAAEGIYSTLLTALIPQALVSALVASLVTAATSFRLPEVE
jgi:rod shape-determining protein MreD